MMRRIVGAGLIIIEFFIPLIIISVCYVRMAQVLKVNKVQPKVNKVQSKVNKGQETEQTTMEDTQGETGQEQQQISSRNVKARKNIFKTLMIVTLCFAVCWIWNQSWFLLYHIGDLGEIKFSSAANQISVVAVLVNCCVNPFIYAAHYNQFRQALRKMKRQVLGVDPQSTTATTSTS